MYILKEIPEDFIVKERSNLTFQQSGRFLYFLLKKKHKNTLQAVQEIAKALHLREKDIGFAGSKDRNAVTEQVISIPGIKKEKVLKLNIPDLELAFLGCRNQPLNLGDLAGNEFIITIRNLEKDVTAKPVQHIVNYFDEQRFSEKNIEIGKFLLQKEFTEAIHLLQNPRLEHYLQTHPKDYVGALKLLPARLLKLYLHAYQSWLWNRSVAFFLSSRKNIQKVSYSQGEFVFTEPDTELLNLEIPLLGADTVITSSEIEAISQKILATENITLSNFILKQIPGLTVMGESRKVFVGIQDFSIKYAPDDLYPGKRKAELQFFLPKGSYATIVVKTLFS